MLIMAAVCLQRWVDAGRGSTSSTSCRVICRRQSGHVTVSWSTSPVRQSPSSGHCPGWHLLPGPPASSAGRPKFALPSKVLTFTHLFVQSFIHLLDTPNGSRIRVEGSKKS